MRRVKEEMEKTNKLERFSTEFLMQGEPLYTTLNGGDVLASMDKSREKFVTRADYNAMFGIEEETISISILNPIISI